MIVIFYGGSGRQGLILMAEKDVAVAEWIDEGRVGVVGSLWSSIAFYSTLILFSSSSSFLISLSPTTVSA